MPAGTAMTVAMVAEDNPSHRLFQNELTKSGYSNTALNQRSESSGPWMVRVFSGVKAITHTTRIGASMKLITSALNSNAIGPFLVMCSPQCFLVTAFDHAVPAEHDGQVRQQQQQGDGGAERPVEFVQVFVIDQRSHHLEAASAQQTGNRKRTGRQPEHDQAAREHPRHDLQQDNTAQ